MRIFRGKKSREWTISRKTRQKEQADYTHKNKRRDRKGESKDSPEISGSVETPNIPGLPLESVNIKSTNKGEDSALERRHINTATKA